MTSQGSPTARFQRALNIGNVTIALAAAAEVPRIRLEDALALCRLLAETGDERYPHAAANPIPDPDTQRDHFAQRRWLHPLPRNYSKNSAAIRAAMSAESLRRAIAGGYVLKRTTNGRAYVAVSSEGWAAIEEEAG